MVRSLADPRDDIAAEDHKERSGDSQHQSAFYRNSSANRHFFPIITD